MIVIEIAAGIILAVFILAFLPWVIVGIAAAFAIAVALTIAGGVVGSVFLIGGNALTALVIGGVFLFVLFDVIKNHRRA